MEYRSKISLLNHLFSQTKNQKSFPSPYFTSSPHVPESNEGFKDFGLCVCSFCLRGNFFVSFITHTVPAIIRICNRIFHQLIHKYMQTCTHVIPHNIYIKKLKNFSKNIHHDSRKALIVIARSPKSCRIGILHSLVVALACPTVILARSRIRSWSHPAVGFPRKTNARRPRFWIRPFDVASAAPESRCPCLNSTSLHCRQQGVGSVPVRCVPNQPTIGTGIIRRLNLFSNFFRIVHGTKIKILNPWSYFCHTS